MKNKTGKYIYAEMGPQGQLSPTQMRVGHMTPSQEQGMPSGLLRPSSIDRKENMCGDDGANRMLRGQEPRRTATTTGTLKTLLSSCIGPITWAEPFQPRAIFTLS
jgi:hypothetical protein